MNRPALQSIRPLQLRPGAALLAVGMLLLAGAVPARAAGPTPVTISTSRSNQGWDLVFHVADRIALLEIWYRFDKQGEFRSTGFQPATNPNTGKPFPNTWVSLPSAWVKAGQHTVEVKLLAAPDQVIGPVTQTLDFEAEALKQAKWQIEQSGEELIAFHEYDDGDAALMLTHVLGYKDVLKEIRYSTNGCALDQRFPFERWTDLVHPPEVTEERPYVILPKTTRSACLQLVFVDGTQTEPRQVERRAEK